jgi:hypothetical protein
MIYISHRGNLTGKHHDLENSPVYVYQAIDKGFDVEVDLRHKDGKIFLGHEKPQYLIDDNFIDECRENLWVHCKDKESLKYALDEDLNCFFHKADDYTLTSKGYVWAFPGVAKANSNTIAVLPELFRTVEEMKDLDYHGYCSDLIEYIRSSHNV